MDLHLTFPCTNRGIRCFHSPQETMGIATPSYASRWYITLYSAGVVPHRTLLRIWDIFLLEGFDWLYFMALALLQYHECKSWPVFF